MRLINPEIRIETTSKCNYNCTICPREKMTRPKTTMPYNHVTELLRQGRELGADFVSLFGYGEPLMDNLIHQKIAAAKKMGYTVDITTNAALLTPSWSYRLLEAGLDSIRFSVHGLKSTYSNVHRGGKWYVVSGNIGEFMKINDSVFKHQCEVHVSVIPMSGENIEDIIDHWEPGGKTRLRVDHLEVWKPHGWAGSRRYRKLNQNKISCGRPFRGPVQIQADGKMIVCCYDTDGKMIVGDTYKDKIETILRGAEFERIRQAHRTGDMDGLLCNGCDQLNEGDSPLLYSTVDPECRAGKTSSTKFQLEE